MTIRIGRIAVERFGALREFTLEPGDVTIVDGDNESGKSSLVDALHAGLRRTFRRGNAPSLEHLRRDVPGYEGEPEVELVDGAGNDAGFPPDLLRENPILWNLLLIPEGGASSREIGSAKRDWLDEAKRHLTGFDPEPIRRLLRGRAGLTPSLRDAKEWRERDEALTRIVEDGTAFLESLDDLAAHEAGLRRTRRQLAAVDAEAAQERQAVAFDRHRRAARALAALRESLRELDRLARFTERELREWRLLDRRREGDAARLEAARRALQDGERSATAAQDRLADGESHRDEIERRLTGLRGAGIADRAREAARRAEQSRAALEAARRWRLPAIAALAVGTVALVAGLAFGRDVATAGGVAAILAGAVMLLREPPAKRRRDAAVAAGAPLVVEARKLGLDVAAVEDVGEALRAVEHNAIAAGERVEHARADSLRLRERRRDLAQARDEAEETLRDTDRAIAGIRERTGLAHLDDLETRVQRRAALEEQSRAARATLAEIFPDTAEADWPARVEDGTVEDPGRAPQGGRLEELERKRDALRDEIDRIEDALDALLRDGLRRLGVADLDGARGALDAALEQRRERECDRAAALLALEAVAENERDVDAHLDRTLTDPREGAGALFARLTGGRWSGIRRGDDGLEAVARDGSGVTIRALSRGTRDQLHFALRAALAERILGEPSFFVWDDTFLTADPDRRRALVASAVELARRGWQIVYLTVDPSIGELFEVEARRHGELDVRRVRLADRAERLV